MNFRIHPFLFLEGLNDDMDVLFNFKNRQEFFIIECKFISL